MENRNTENHTTELETDPALSALVFVSQRKKQVAKLKAKCKELAAAGVTCRKTIGETSGKERYDAWEEKRAIGSTARIHYIAYGLIRGRDYVTIEAKTNDHGDDWALTCRIKAVTKILQEYCIEGERAYWTREHVEKLLRTPAQDTGTKVRSDG